MPSSIQVLADQDPAKFQETFARDVRKGLNTIPKRISCAYFYNERGSRIFQEIMDMPDYYLTDCEHYVLETYKHEIAVLLDGRSFRLIELGAGDGRKTQTLLNHFHKCGFDFEYIPIDISRSAMTQLMNNVTNNFPNLRARGIVCEYEQGLHSLKQDNRLNFVLFLGSSLGNFNMDQAMHFCRQLNTLLFPGDLFLLGLDLVKDPNVIEQAYNDPTGITERFNLNLLHRINQELGGNFDTSLFKHHACYDPIAQTMQSYLLSLQKQSVEIKALGAEFYFEAWEPIHTEYSWKYSFKNIIDLASQSNFSVLRSFTDPLNYFLNTLWQAKPRDPL